MENIYIWISFQYTSGEDTFTLAVKDGAKVKQSWNLQPVLQSLDFV